MNILTDEEIKSTLDKVSCCLEDVDIAYSRAIEAAVMSKLAEQDVEPVGEVTHRAFGYVKWASDRPEIGTKLYTETQLLAAQQRTAEACAKACEAVRAEDGDGQHRAWYAGIDLCIEAIRNGEWREYL